MLSNSDSTIVAPCFSRSSKSRLSYRASLSFVCRFVRVGLCVPTRVSVICRSIRMSVCLLVSRVVSVYINFSVGFDFRNCLSETEFEKDAVINEFRRFSN